MRKSVLVLTLVVGISVAVAVTGAAAQASASVPESPSFHLAAGTTIPTELSKSLDVRKLKRGDSFELRTLVGLVSHDRIVVPERTRIIGHVTDVKTSTKGESDSKMGISFDSMIFSDGREVEFQAALQAIGKHLVGEYYIPMPGGGGGVVTQPEQTTLGTTVRLSSRDEGVVGLPDLSLETFVHGGLIRSKNSNVRLEAGAQFLLRVTNEQSEAMGQGVIDRKPSGVRPGAVVAGQEAGNRVEMSVRSAG
jgi:hypothetical protein